MAFCAVKIEIQRRMYYTVTVVIILAAKRRFIDEGFFESTVIHILPDCIGFAKRLFGSCIGSDRSFADTDDFDRVDDRSGAYVDAYTDFDSDTHPDAYADAYTHAGIYRTIDG
jgi:hypothetical protein